MSEKHCAPPEALGCKIITLTGISVPESNVHPDFNDPRGDVVLEDKMGSYIRSPGTCSAGTGEFRVLYTARVLR